MMNEKDRERAIAAATTAWRPDAVHELPVHPDWYDLDEEGREQAFADTGVLRRMEAALDPQGWSSTVHAVLRRIAADESKSG